MSSYGNEINFNETPLKIKNYVFDEEKDDLLTLGKFLVDFKYLVKNECNLNIINNTNINVSININNFNPENAKEERNISSTKDINDKNKNNIVINKINHLKNQVENILDGSKNKIRGIKEDKPIKIIENKNIIKSNDKAPPENKSFKILQQKYCEKVK